MKQKAVQLANTGRADFWRDRSTNQDLGIEDFMRLTTVEGVEIRPLD